MCFISEDRGAPKKAGPVATATIATIVNLALITGQPLCFSLPRLSLS